MTARLNKTIVIIHLYKDSRRLKLGNKYIFHSLFRSVYIPLTTHNSLIRSDEGWGRRSKRQLSNSCTVVNLPHELSC